MFLADNELRFEYMLTRELGLGTVENMYQQMTNQEFIRWVALYRREADEREKARQNSKAGGVRRRG